MNLFLGMLSRLPDWIAAGEATIGLFQRIREMVRDDRSLTPEEREKIEALIAEKMAVVNDTSRDL